MEKILNLGRQKGWTYGLRIVFHTSAVKKTACVPQFCLSIWLTLWVNGCCVTQSDGTKAWPGPYAEIAAQRESTCALERSGVLRCWGTGSVAKEPLPTTVFKRISLGSNCGVGLRSDNTLQGWGAGCESPPSGTFVDVGLGREGCAINSVGDLICWALSGATMIRPDGGAPVKLPPRGNTITAGPFTKVAMGSGHGCALRATGAVHCWGYCRATNTGSTNCPARVAPPKGDFIDIASGNDFSCVLDRAHGVQCWGELSVFGTSSLAPFRWSNISARDNTLCGLTSSGEVECAGEPVNWNSKVYTPPPGPFVSVAVGGRHVCALRPSGVAECWGVDQQGQVTGIPPWPRT